MTDKHNPDKAMAGILKRKSVWPSAKDSEACPDAATLAAYFERSLTVTEMADCETHFSNCARCQEQLAALVRSEPASAATPAMESKPAFSWLWNWRFLAPVGAVVALAFYISTLTLRAPLTTTSPGELVARREAASQPPATAESQKPDVSPQARSDSATNAAPRAKALTAERAQKGRSALDELQRKNASGLAGPAPPKQALKDKSALADGIAADSLAARVPAKPAEEGKVSALESRVAVAQAPAAPAQVPAPAAQSAPKQDRAVAAADEKALALEVRGKEQDAARKEAVQSNQAAAAGRFAAMEAAPPSASRLRKAPAEFTVSAPNSNVLWRFGSDGRIERSRDAGKTWEAQKSPVRESFLAGSAPTEKICWLAGKNGVLLRTTDGGENWERMPSPTKSDIIAVKASGPFNVTLGAADGRTYETRDAGANWSVH